MNNFILINTPVAVVTVVLLILFAVGFWIQTLALQKEVDKNRLLKKRNSFLRERLSVTQQELYRKGFKLPEVEDNG